MEFLWSLTFEWILENENKEERRKIKEPKKYFFKIEEHEFLD